MSKHSQESNNSDEEFEGFTFEEIKKNFRALAKEIKKGGANVEELVSQTKIREIKETIPIFHGYEPQIFDFLARATTHDECEEIIAYCLSRSEVSIEIAKELRNRLAKGGPRAFGTRKPGYYDSKL